MLKLWELAPSPNNTKVVMALRYKGIEFTSQAVDPLDRAPVLAASGQELTPVIEDKGIVLPESEAILHYLDANYRDTPRLFPPGRAGRHACDDWKRTLDERLARHWLPVFLYAIERVDELDAGARGAFAEGLAWVESELADKQSFAAAGGAVCDLRVAQWATYALPGEGLLRRVPLFRHFREVFGQQAEDYPRLTRFLEPWNERLG